jgi:hypothetical protein
MAVVAFESVLHQAKVDIEDESAKSLTMTISNGFGYVKMLVCNAYGSPPRPQTYKACGTSVIHLPGTENATAMLPFFCIGSQSSHTGRKRKHQSTYKN